MANATPAAAFLALLVHSSCRDRPAATDPTPGQLWRSSTIVDRLRREYSASSLARLRSIAEESHDVKLRLDALDSLVIRGAPNLQPIVLDVETQLMAKGEPVPQEFRERLRSLALLLGDPAALPALTDRLLDTNNWSGSGFTSLLLEVGATRYVPALGALAELLNRQERSARELALYCLQIMERPESSPLLAQYLERFRPAVGTEEEELVSLAMWTLSDDAAYLSFLEQWTPESRSLAVEKSEVLFDMRARSGAEHSLARAFARGTRAEWFELNWVWQRRRMQELATRRVALIDIAGFTIGECLEILRRNQCPCSVSAPAREFLAERIDPEVVLALPVTITVLNVLALFPSELGWSVEANGGIAVMTATEARELWCHRAEDIQLPDNAGK